jgi:hypothetical protein
MRDLISYTETWSDDDWYVTARASGETRVVSVQFSQPRDWEAQPPMPLDQILDIRRKVLEAA